MKCIQLQCWLVCLMRNTHMRFDYDHWKVSMYLNTNSDLLLVMNFISIYSTH